LFEKGVVELFVELNILVNGLVGFPSEELSRTTKGGSNKLVLDHTNHPHKVGVESVDDFV
jgi:hypothetical protein